MLCDILLEQGQKELLAIVVEAARNVPRDKRRKFMFISTAGGSIIEHPGLPNEQIEAYKGDIETLARKGLLAVSYGQYGSLSFDVTPEGFQYYEKMKIQTAQPVQRIEQYIRSFMEAGPFRQKYKAAYEKWAEAEAKLWSSDAENQLTDIGHHCREALQEFMSVLVTQYGLPSDSREKSHTVDRLKGVINIKASQLSNTEKKFLDALLEYWREVDQLTQRQEHGGQKEGRPLVWEDGRRVVFQTAIVMFEVDRSLSQSQ